MYLKFFLLHRVRGGITEGHGEKIRINPRHSCTVFYLFSIVYKLMRFIASLVTKSPCRIFCCPVVRRDVARNVSALGEASSDSLYYQATWKSLVL